MTSVIDTVARGMLPKLGARLLLISLLVLATVPVVADSYFQGMVARMMIFALFASSLNVILGYAGLASLGHAAYFGIGAYVVAKLSLAGVTSLWLQLGAACAVASVLAGVFGLLILRTRGSYLLMITLALAQVVWGIAYGWRAFTGADDGLPGVRRPVGLLMWELSGDTGFYYFVFAVFVVAILAIQVLVDSPFGRALVGIRENERRMSALGYEVWSYKYLACVLAGLVACISGALLAWQNGFVGPSYLSINYSAMALIMVILGGAGTVLGPVIGAFLVVALENIVSGMTERWVMVLGAIYVLVTLFAPDGLAGLLRGRAKAAP